MQLFLSNFTLKDIAIYINHKSWILPFGLRGVQSGGTEAFNFNRTTALKGAMYHVSQLSFDNDLT